ncbi:hypothetical protein DIPPA_18124 [Diplonema papillatum]|nr:hypothetical protein DIPPA_13302 [Diplonema papillatum]KAJ9460800.1 hypothetical protein DIPPA_18218 [Diplonema papillatum]KAJ9466825.1 hypothetical protein DIPPA_34109 [Diplonema papillatum]KAJ9469897.1 hypothetical protein DIPPA_18081 [Diplonema papillatum]KAJ9469916.1 hypothetical protein DIPPA_18124 [Diplonema papillatum]
MRCRREGRRSLLSFFRLWTFAPPFSQEGWTHGGETEERGFVLPDAGVLQRKEARGREDAPMFHPAVSLQRLLVAAALAGALGPSPLVFVFACPAVVTNIACRYRLQVAKEYDRMRGVQLASANRPREGEQLAAGVVRQVAAGRPTQRGREAQHGGLPMKRARGPWEVPSRAERASLPPARQPEDRKARPPWMGRI